MARMMDDSSRAKMLSALLDQQTPENDGGYNNEPKVTAMPPGAAPREDDAEQVNDAMPGPLPSGQRGEPMIQVPASLAHAGMQALMAQASGGRSLGADGQIASLPPDDSFIPGNDPERATDSEVEEEEENNAKRKKSAPVRRRG